MLRSVYLKTIRDRWFGAVIAVGSLFLIAWMGLWAYAGLGDEAISFVEQMPDAYLSLVGITPDAGVAGLMLSNMFNFMGPFVIIGIAVSMGAAAIAGEEKAGTMDVLASMPRSRSRLLTSTTLAVLTMVVAISALSWLSYLLAVALSGTDVGSLNLVAATVHVAAVAFLHAALATALGAWTGNRALASGVTVTLVIAGFLAAGLLPLVEGWEYLAKAFPWYYIGGATPLVNGIDWPQVVVLLAISAALFVAARWALDHRDLRSGGGATVPLIARLRSDPRLARSLDLLAGSGSARGLGFKATTDLRALLTIAGGGMLFIGVVMGLLFNAISGSIGDVVEAMPDGILAMVGFADYSTAAGWYYGEALSIVAPVAVAVVAISAGTALSREEKDRTISVLLGTPTSRTRVALGKLTAMVVGSAVVGLATIAGIALGNAVASLGIDDGNIVASGVLLAALGLVLGSVSFVAGALTGRATIATGAGIGVAVVGWGINSFLPINPDLADWAAVSPFYYFAHGNPLDVGMTWWYLAVLVGVAALLAAVGTWGYGRRDLTG